MTKEDPYQKILQESLREGLRVLNAQLPQKQKPLSALLGEEHPHVICNDGSLHLFKRKELDYLASLLDAGEQKELWLPMLIRVSSDRDELAIVCRNDLEAKTVSKVLDMPLALRQGRIIIYRHQLSLLRKVIRTTTQYVFSAEPLA